MTRAGEEQDVWVGIDIGTQSARAIAVDAAGGVAGSGAAPLRSRRDGPRHEQDPASWWAAGAAACREALAHVAPQRVRGVATCATSGTVVLMDPGGAPIGPGLMYDDARAGWGLPKLLRLLDQASHPSGARLAHQADIVTAQLVGHPVAADWSHALKSGYDLVAERWPAELLDALGGVLPDVVAPGTSLGEVCAQASARTLIPRGTPVIAGMTDGCAGQIAAGALGAGQWNSVLGTTLVLKGACRDRIDDPNGVLYCHRSPDGDWLPGGASSAGAGVLAQRFAGVDLDALTARAAAYEDTQVIAYPLVSRGERFPFAAPDAEAFMVGQPADDGEHAAALLQGLAFVERLCFDYVDMLGAPTDGQVSLTGGAAANAYLCQLRADVLGRPVALVENAESAFGMAVLAASHGGRLADAAGRMVHVREIIEPRAGAERWGERYDAFVSELQRRWGVSVSGD